jgi:small-conductance mechanosensitive channel
MTISIKTMIGKIIAPLVICAIIFTLFYIGGDSYQTFGIAAVDSTRRALKYVLGVIAFLSLAILSQRIIRYVVFDGIVAKATGAPVPRLLSQISGLVIYLIAISACAGIVFEQDLTVLWAASGVAGLVFGMALKELLQDVFAGIALNIDRAVRIGEYIRLHKAGDDTVAGQLLEISWRTSRIKDFYGDIVILPNSKFSSCTVTNFSQPEPSSFRFVTVTLDARVPQARAARILQAAALEALLGLVGPEVGRPWVEVKSIKLEGIEYAVYYKAEWRHLVNARPLILQNILAHLAHAGLEPASPRQELVTNSPGTGGLQRPDIGRLVSLIGTAPLFQGLTEDDLLLLATSAQLRVQPADQVVVQAGEAGTILYLIIEGLLSADAGRRKIPRSDQRPMLRPGDLFDPAVALLGEAHSRTVRTATPALLCELSREGFGRLFKSNPDAIYQIGRNLAAQKTPGGATGALSGVENTDLVDDILRHMRHYFADSAAASS